MNQRNLFSVTTYLKARMEWNIYTLSALKMAVTLPENAVKLELGHLSQLKISDG